MVEYSVPNRKICRFESDHPLRFMRECPKCGKKEQWEIGWISTTNEWRWHCLSCDIRFNDDGVIYTPEKV